MRHVYKSVFTVYDACERYRYLFWLLTTYATGIQIHFNCLQRMRHAYKSVSTLCNRSGKTGNLFSPRATDPPEVKLLAPFRRPAGQESNDRCIRSSNFFDGTDTKVNHFSVSPFKVGRQILYRTAMTRVRKTEPPATI